MMQYSAGLAWKFGGPKATDVTEELSDKDGDGVPDCRDECPDVAGLVMFHGCPDTDGDGIPDIMDKCPDVFGLKILQGCPDRDGDGTADKDDACPDVPGPKTNAGCPFKDTDGDGVINLIDRCVEVKGPASNYGCPVLPTVEIMSELNEYGRTILFDYDKWSFKKESYAVLQPMTTILKNIQTLILLLKDIQIVMVQMLIIKYCLKKERMLLEIISLQMVLIHPD